MSEQVQAAMTTLQEQIRKFVERSVEKGIASAREELTKAFEAAVAAAVAALPAPKDGERGADGKDAVVDYEAIKAMLPELIPAPIAGKDGVDGKDAEVDYKRIDEQIAADFKSVHQVLGEMVPAAVAAAVETAVKALPPAKDGMNGINGKDGQDGQDGKDGADGRDSLELEILPEINPARIYSRGTFARHRGGLVRSIRSTSPVKDGNIIDAGWETIVEGIAQVQVEQLDDIRTFAFGIETTSGAVLVEKFALPALIDRGIFNPDEAYVKGDVVSSNGSMWIAQGETKGDRPGASQVWRLSVKHGRDGKDFDAPKRPPEKVSLR